MPDWNTRLAVSYTDEDGNTVELTPIDAFSADVLAQRRGAALDRGNAHRRRLLAGGDVVLDDRQGDRRRGGQAHDARAPGQALRRPAPGVRGRRRTGRSPAS